MNETIGAKGSNNDLRRSLRISKEKKQKLKEYQEQEELKKLEDKVKRLQKVTFIKIFPVALTGQIFKTLTTNTKKPKYIEQTSKKLNISFSDKSKEEVIPSKIFNDNYYHYEISKEETKEPLQKESVEIKEIKQEEIPLIKTEINNQDIKKIMNLENGNTNSSIKQNLENKQTESSEIYYFPKKNNLNEEKIDLKETKPTAEINLKETPDLNKEIINDNVSFNESQIEKLEENVPLKTEDLKLSSSISKEPEESIKAKDNNEESFTKKENFQTKNLPENEESLDLIKFKEDYFNYEKFNKELSEFEKEQEFLLKEIKEKVNKALTIEEKVKVEVQAMNYQSKKLFRLLSLQMFLPGFQSAKSLATAACTYLYFIDNIIKPKTVTKKYKVINVQDYSEDIKRNLNSLNNMSNYLGNTKSELNKTISNFKSKYAAYLDTKECLSLLKNLEKVRKNLDDKEYELELLAEQQRRTLEKNNIKVLRYKK